ncbi:MAG: A/G-specific adenine glycosylase [Limnohabitans sp.]|nr:A/G-specific adenine glycosylase [Limnohabitans sp.]
MKRSDATQRMAKSTRKTAPNATNDGRTKKPLRAVGRAGSRNRGSDGATELLVAWFQAAARDLPWRRARDGYRALVSELMLQQTQVSRVVEKFEPFLARFPTPAALAAATEDEVLAAWQGLGYYRRARLLHAAAKAVVERHAGEVPTDPEALRALPGVGRYTAGAVSSIVFGAREPIVDGNVTRVFQRVEAREGSASDTAVQAWAWERAEAFVAAARAPGVANEALMELGATVCTPATPRCGACPLRAQCAAFAAGRVDEIPAPKKRVARKDLVLVTACVRRTDGAVLLEQRPRGGLWGGLWQPPAVESADGADLAPRAVGELLGLPATAALAAVGEVPFMTTHRAVRFVVFVAKVRGSGAAFAARGRVWVAADALGEFALSNAAKRVLASARV